MQNENVYTDQVTGIQFRATPDGWEMRGVLGGFAAPREGWRDAGPHVAAAALRVFGPPLPEKPRVVTLDNGGIIEIHGSFENDEWELLRYGDDTDNQYLPTMYGPGGLIATLDRLQNEVLPQNGSADGAGDDE